MVDGVPSRSYLSRQRVAGLVLALAATAAVVTVVMSWSSFRRVRPAPFWPPWFAAGERRSLGSGQEPIATYVGSDACLRCHPAESALFGRSGHHRTLTRGLKNPVVAWLDGRKVKDPELADVTWSYHVRDDKLVADREIDGKTESIALDYALGSGKHGITFVAIQNARETGSDPTGIEHRISYFSDGRRLAITPGQQKADDRQPSLETPGFGHVLGRDRLRKCFACHGTVTSAHSPNRLDTATLIPNVSCERCHGPGEMHVESAGRGETALKMQFGLDRVESRVEVAFCGECHGLPFPLPTSTITPDNVRVVRFQSAGLSKSRCYAGGLGALRCTSCHDPHDKASRNHAAYESVCLSCHRSGSTQKSCSESPAENCIDCHMPRREVPPGGLFTDHWIRRNAPAPRETARRPAT